MTESNWFILAIIIYMLAMLAIGYWSYRQTDEYDEYMLAGRKLGPFTAALSAGASDMSGWLLMGLPGALFVTGMSELWIAIGLLIGCWASWKLVAPRLRSYTEIADNSITLPSFFENRLDDKTHVLRVASAVIILVFFTFYISSGMVSGGRYFESTFGGDYLTGMMLVAFVTVAYTFIGGFMAVAYTDVVQGTIMFLALLIVPVVAYFTLSDTASLTDWATTQAYGPWDNGNPDYFNMISGVSIAAIIGNLAWGLGYFGQPHIVVRYMALTNTHEAKNGRRIGIFWMFLCIVGATAVAIVGTAFFGADPTIHVTDQENFETIFLDMGRILFHPLVAGLILTAVLAAIMSTLSSQLLVVSSALIEDLFKLFKKELPSNQTMINLSRTAVVAVSLVAAAMAINPSDSILGLVAFAWAGFGSAFGPLMLASLYWRRLNMPGAISGMVVGAVVSFGWGMTPALADQMYEMVPGFIAASLALYVVSIMTQPPADYVVEEFDTATQLHEVAADNPEMDMEEAAEIVLEEENSTGTNVTTSENPWK
ncbi:sodium/proline symporter PutP [Corynebacterium ulceribovis]|uniref:sodium/proline symporter PutP n=1 Tax=Corynebacterium ulceribovis TaxID=487732 RepID=UPI0003690471|nr:sodium/proline symporter PutP [Corynebacterium ulceribovis]